MYVEGGATAGMDEGCRCSGMLVPTRLVLSDGMKGEDRCARHGGGKVSQTLLMERLQDRGYSCHEELVLSGSQASGSLLRTKIWSQCGETQLRGPHTWSSLTYPILFP